MLKAIIFIGKKVFLVKGQILFHRVGVRVNPVTIDSIEDKFSTLSTEEKISIISHGVALRLSNWRKRLFLTDRDNSSGGT
jgi:hypothetical protein